MKRLGTSIISSSPFLLTIPSHFHFHSQDNCPHLQNQSTKQQNVSPPQHHLSPLLASRRRPHNHQLPPLRSRLQRPSLHLHRRPRLNRLVHPPQHNRLPRMEHLHALSSHNITTTQGRSSPRRTSLPEPRHPIHLQRRSGPGKPRPGR